MKKSSEYAIGESVLIEDLVLTKQSDEITTPGSSISTVEIWVDQNGKQYFPALRFSLGQAEPSFNKLS